MKEIYVTYEQMLNDYPNMMAKFIDELKYHLNGNVLIEEMELFYYWRLSSTTTDSKIEEYKHLLTFDERLDYESSKIQIEIYIRYGTYIRGEVMDDYDKPKIILDELSRLLVSTMRYEQSIYLNQSVIDSIPTDVEPDEQVKYFLESLSSSEEEIEEAYTLDELLDKISKYGYNNLTSKEKKLLDKLSNG
jgi:hypothetical protein